MTRRFGWAGLALTLAAPGAAAQARPGGGADFVLGATYSRWRFKDVVQQDSFAVRSASQFAVPIGATVRAGRVTIDASGSVTSGQVGLEGGRSLTLSGLTDVRVRGVAQVIGDRLLVTAGLNLPLGATGLSGRQIDALGVVGSSAMGFSAPALGNGFGGSGGLVYAFAAGQWGVAFGTSLEARSQYTPIEAQLAGVKAPADYSPGTVVRFSLGADRMVGRGRLSLLLTGDRFGESRIQVSPAGGEPLESRYTLGPQVSGTVLADFGLAGVRSLRLILSDRYRSRFAGADGAKIPGSSGNVFDSALELVTGGPRGAGLYLRAEGRLDGGLSVDNSVATAAMSSAGLSLGAAVVNGRTTVLPYVRFQAGRLDTGNIATTATGYGAGISLTVRP